MLPFPTGRFSVTVSQQWSRGGIVAVRILQELQQHSAQLSTLLVGEGRAYTHLGIPLIASSANHAPVASYMDGRQLVRFGEWLTSTDLGSAQAVRSWAQTGGAI